jgi:hypothetical protein
VFANDGPALAKRGCVAPAGTATAIKGVGCFGCGS